MTLIGKIVGGGIGCFMICLIWLGIPAIFITAMSFWTDRNLDFWATYAHQGTPTNVPHWISWLASIPLPVTFLFNLGSEIARYVI